LWGRVTEGYGALPAFGLIHRSKSETQGQLSWRDGAVRARLGLLFLGLAGHLFPTISSAIAFRVCKKDYYFFSSKMQYEYQKTQKLMLIASPLKTLLNNSCEKSYQQKS
jgi:hypothetical protein